MDQRPRRGREISSRNSEKHGFYSCHSLLLACENPAFLRRLEAEYRNIYQPATPSEATLVAQMVAARWRIRRLWTLEVSLFNDEMSRQVPLSENPCYEFARAFRTLVDGSQTLSLSSRLESRQQRIHDRAWKNLRELQQLRIKKMKERTQAGSVL